ncbi:MULTISPECIES: helix-turn-helix domain-containing protein [unclassified Nocardioides]|uniref:helix-turn-helix domain-containing protein n=1 Tax=unclassified Nocardioides TaxID=2615069 RepID=UPI0009F13C90|nr:MULTISPECIES: helix-turn-helix domain-containing protein [unclassified Nocardioides]GAW47946.1 Putative IS630 family ISPsy1-like transposase [Nocardioides sp. PD653-B2]GAW53751.1 putative IS630 family ISPsy1-like transposase [Nocardioides sp. PD653]
MPDSRFAPLVLEEAESDQLRAWARRPKTAQALALRARIVLRCAAGNGEDSNTVVAEELDVARGTVAKWRCRFLIDRLDGLLDEPRPGRPRTVTDAQVDKVITRTDAKDAIHLTRLLRGRAHRGGDPCRGARGCPGPGPGPARTAAGT